MKLQPDVAMELRMPVAVEGWYALPRNTRRDPPLTRPHDSEFLAAAQFEDGTWEPVREVRYPRVENKPPGSVFRQFPAGIPRGFDIFIAGQFYPVPYWGEFQVHQVEHLPFELRGSHENTDSSHRINPTGVQREKAE